MNAKYVGIGLVIASLGSFGKTSHAKIYETGDVEQSGAEACDRASAGLAATQPLVGGTSQVLGMISGDDGAVADETASSAIAKKKKGGDGGGKSARSGGHHRKKHTDKYKASNHP